MSRNDKLLARFLQCPADFSWGELVALLAHLGFTEIQGRGSRVKFYNIAFDCLIQLHKPHPSSVLKRYTMREVSVLLVRAGLI